ncbi:DNA-nicking Smr family endonuclease [Orbus hercynius]|uniref:Ribosome rescue factor SmrB n=1 Tax=Orbus hercynius TaxID=593135 RepID=A0A495REP9_9GAMM|nr:endonuclease SmrB [Orbus hercynius]RKS85790.1 DNA-nicking Smr family endonuclease [Orbus hercynius]
MSKNYRPSDEELALFKNVIGNAKKLKQDTVVHAPARANKTVLIEKKQQQETINSEFYFSDDFQPLLLDDPIRYCREEADPSELKKLRQGFYEPELFLDLHGLTQNEAKKEIAALITACIRERIPCASVMYGHGKNILKKQTPMWLAQHPDIICFHQAPKEFGGSAALLILFDLDKHQDNFFKS